MHDYFHNVLQVQIYIMKGVATFLAIFWVSLSSTQAHEIAKEGMSYLSLEGLSQTCNRWGWNARCMNIFVI